MEYKIYIAYGSNINTEQMALRCPDSRVIGVSCVHDYKLVFRGHSESAVATIEPEEGSSVPVLVWKISKKDEAHLDIYEGYPQLYVKKLYRIELNGAEVNAMAYVMTPGRSEGKPSARYFNTIAQGYREFGFDLDFLRRSAGLEYESTDPAERVRETAEKQKRREFTACPRCGGWMRRELYLNCLSRRAHIYVCEKCGMAEALADHLQKNDPIEDWYICQ